MGSKFISVEIGSDEGAAFSKQLLQIFHRNYTSIDTADFQLALGKCTLYQTQSRLEILMLFRVIILFLRVIAGISLIVESWFTL